MTYEERLAAATATRRLISTHYQEACKVSDKAKQEERDALVALDNAHTEFLAAKHALAEERA